MNVKELIEKLKEFDPEQKVAVFNGEFCNEVENVELHSFSSPSGDDCSELYEDDEGKLKLVYIG